MYQNNYPSKRYKITIDFVQKHISDDENILDLGIENPLSKILKENRNLIKKKTYICHSIIFAVSLAVTPKLKVL